MCNDNPLDANELIPVAERVGKLAVPPMLWIPNQLEAAYIGQDVMLECHSEAYPKSINYWTTVKGDMIISGTSMSKMKKNSSTHSLGDYLIQL